mgnify:CR=1 FL=1
MSSLNTTATTTTKISTTIAMLHMNDIFVANTTSIVFITIYNNENSNQILQHYINNVRARTHTAKNSLVDKRMCIIKGLLVSTSSTEHAIYILMNMPYVLHFNYIFKW